MKKEIETTLLIIVKNNKILLCLKKRGFGKGKYNGVGGKRQGNETIYETMLRETKEEINVIPINAKNVGIIDFDLWIENENVIEKMFIYLAKDYEGEMAESDEMKPEWFDVDKIPYDNMFVDDILWLGDVLKGKCVKGKCVFDKEINTMISHDIQIIDNI